MVKPTAVLGEIEEVKVVEKILDKRLPKEAEAEGEYYVRWKGLGEEHDSWVVRGLLECHDLIDEFEEDIKMDEEEVEEKQPTPPVVHTNENKLHGFDRDLKPVMMKFKEKSVKMDEEEEVEEKEPTPPVVQTNENKLYGFDRDLKPVCIKAIANTRADGIVFKLQWDDGSEEVVPSRVANDKCPQVVIKFYEEKIVWNKPATEPATKRRATSNTDNNRNTKKSRQSKRAKK